MTDAADPYAPRPLAGWFYAAAVASFAVMLLGCVVYVMHVRTDPQALDLDARAAFLAIPAWVTAANAIAVWVGLAGTGLLIARRRAAEKLLLLSLVATVVWLGGLLLTPGTRAQMTQNDMAVLLGIAALVWTIFWFARHSRQRGWLR